ncbi:MAG: hypothetical protein JSW47_19840, partial [Phycisphaerales bacterium]
MKVCYFIIAFLIIFATVFIVQVHLAEDAQPAAKSDARSFHQKLEDERVLLREVEAIGKRDPTDRGPVRALIEAMDNESHRVRSAAARALLRIGPVNKQVVL